MPYHMTRRNFLELSLLSLVSACSGSSSTDTSSRTYAPDDPDIQYTGRIDFSDARAPKFSAPGVYLKARFRGTSAAVMLEDEFKWGSNRNYYDVIIDDAPVVKLTPERMVTRYEVASGLENKEHSITLVKRTEASIGYCKFLGFEFAGEILPAPKRRTRRMEFIGDSITCGTGDEAVVNSPQCLEDGWGQPYNNVRLSYGPVLANALGADYHVSAVSGIGLVRNYSFKYDPRPLPEVYDSLFFERTDSPGWDPKKFVPQVIVIALGTNDFSPGDSERPSMEVDTFVTAYIKFIDKLRGYYPKAEIFCASSPMLGDRWPSPTDTFATDQKNAITKVVEELNARGDAKVHKVFVPQIVGMGCTTHPSVDQHAAMASLLEGIITSTLGW